MGRTGRVLRPGQAPGDAVQEKAESQAELPLEPGGIRLGVVRGISYGLFGPPGEFVPQARAVGAGLIRAYLYWSQVEPEPGQYRWETVDALLGQLGGDEELWITLCSSSPWGTRQPTDFLPPSPALDQPTPSATVTDVFGRTWTARCQHGQIHLPVSVTPLFIEA